MREIQGQARTVRELLKGVKYSVDYYQREYKWQEKQIRELVGDLTEKFLQEYDASHSRRKVAEYPHYFLGSIIISRKDAASFIVDGQQRLTSLTLLLMLLRALQKDRSDRVNVDELIVSEKYGEKSFNLHVDERTPCMEALFDGTDFDPTGQPESVRNLHERYQDLEDEFAQVLNPEDLPYFTDWLLENVHLVEITAFSDDDAYTIFETMNDRGLSLSPTEMLKGYLLARIESLPKRTAANAKWRDRVRELNEAGKEVEPDFFKAWLRSQYATKIREKKRGAEPEDYDRIGTEFHRWLRETSDKLGLRQSDDFYRFIERDFEFYSRQYLRLVEAAGRLVPGFEHVFYNAQLGFTLQHMLLLAALRPDEPEPVLLRKVGLVGRFIDILLTWRIWNYRDISYSTMHHAIFGVMRDIRGLAPDPLARKLHDTLQAQSENLHVLSDYHRPGVGLRMHQQNRRVLHRILARLTDYIETQSGNPSRYADYVSDGRNRFEVEHILANHFERHTAEYAHPSEFGEQRNRIGGLLLLPKQFNASYGDLTYEAKLPHYNTQGLNLLARSLHPQCYEHNPGFVQFVSSSGLRFRPLERFTRVELDARSELYRAIAQRIWNPDDLLPEVEA